MNIIVSVKMTNLIEKANSFLEEVYFKIALFDSIGDRVVWTQGSPHIKNEEINPKNESNFKNCEKTCRYISTNKVSLDWLSSQVTKSANSFSLGYLSLVFEFKSNQITGSQLEWISLYYIYIDLLAIVILFVIIFYLNIKLMGRVYYVIFSQINLFTHKLRRYSKNMLKPAELSPISIDDLLFVEANEISDFFIVFFELFHQNRENNSFDMTDSIEKITSQLKKTRKFRKKFNETIADGFIKIYDKAQTVVLPSTSRNEPLEIESAELPIPPHKKSFIIVGREDLNTIKGSRFKQVEMQIHHNKSRDSSDDSSEKPKRRSSKKKSKLKNSNVELDGL